VRIALVGQPNSGKSTFFNAVAGYRSLTSNFAGTTVEYTRGRGRVNGDVFELVDLPGLYSLTSTSPAEACTREFLLEHGWDVLIHIVDASQLARSLELTLELLDLEAPLLLCLNMMDEATRKGMTIDGAALSAELGVPVVEAIAARGQGIVETFRAAIKMQRQSPSTPAKPFLYAPEIEDLVEDLAEAVRPSGSQRVTAAPQSRPSTPGAVAVIPLPMAGAKRTAHSFNPRFEALQLLQSDPLQLALTDPVRARATENIAARITQQLNHPPDVALSSARHAACLNLFERVVHVTKPKADWREQVDRVLMHPLWGYVFLAAIFIGFFRLVFAVGKLCEGRILTLFQQLIALLGQAMDPQGAWFALAQGALLGTAGAVAIVLPYLLPFLIGLSILEDVGYLARVGYLMDAVMHRLGLHGTATIPVLLGYGCSVPAVMATRILPSRRDRFVAALLGVLVPCSARMTVIFALVGFYLGAYWALAIYVLNLGVVALAGNVLAKIWPEIAPGMLMEVPPYRRPSSRVVLLKTWWRLREFVVIAIPLLVVGSAVLGLVEFFGWQNAINAALSPLTALLGLPAAVGLTLIFGVLRKELSLLMLMQALGTTEVNSVMSAAQIVIFTLFVTFYLPCLATLAAMVRELGRKLTFAASGALLVLAVVISLAARGVLHFLL
jgi:ferrous iron transport protein B